MEDLLIRIMKWLIVGVLIFATVWIVLKYHSGEEEYD